MSRIIEISVKDRIAWQTNRVEYICDNSDFVVEFDFDSEWEGIEPKTARFIHGEQYTDVVFMGNQCPVPVITDVTKMQVGVFAGNLQTTTPVTIICKNSILCGDGIPADPTPDVYTQIMEVIVPEAVLNAEESAKAAESAKTEAEKAASEATQAAQSVPQTVEDALKKAKESGEFDGPPGKDGEPGKDGYTPIKGVDYFDGKDGQPGKDGRDGKDGEPGQPGKDGKDYILTEADKDEIAKLAGGIKTVNGQSPDASGNVEIEAGGIKTVNGVSPDENGNVQVETSSQADWNASEGEPGHVLNRTHCVEKNRVMLLEPTSLIVEGLNSALILDDPLNLVVGETYTVEWNGTPYECKAEAFTQNAVSGVILGEAPNEEGTEQFPFVVIEATLEGIPVRQISSHDGNSFTVSIYQETETIRKLPGKFLPDGVPYVDKDGGRMEILAECQPTYIADEGMFLLTENAPPFVVGETYIVNWNGTEYTCVGQDLSVMMAGAVGLGDVGQLMGGTSTGEPFAIASAYQDDTQGLVILPMDGTTELTLSIKGEGETVHKLDPKFLPEIPTFDLTEMGLPAISFGTTAEAEADVTQVCDAMDKGVVKLKFLFNPGNGEVPAAIIAGAMVIGGTSYMIAQCASFQGNNVMIVIEVARSTGGIRVSLKMLS